MIIPDGSADDEKKSNKDFTGMIKIATAIVVGILTIVGFGWEDLMGKSHNTSVNNKKAEVKKSDEYEGVYLDEEIDEDALDKKETGLKNSEENS